MTKFALQPGDKVVRYWAVFDGENQLTRWRRNRQQTLGAFRRRSNNESKMYKVRHRDFIHRNGESQADFSSSANNEAVAPDLGTNATSRASGGTE